MSETVPGHAELVAELAELEAANEAADGWGAAVGARQERINSIRRTLSARQDKVHSMPAPCRHHHNTPRRTCCGEAGEG